MIQKFPTVITLKLARIVKHIEVSGKITVELFLFVLMLSQFVFISGWPAMAEQAGSSGFDFKKILVLSTPGPAVAVSWSPDGKKLVAASNYGSDLSVWTGAGHLIRHIRRLSGGPSVGGYIAFLRGSTEVAFLPPSDAPGPDALSIWNVETGVIINSVVGPQPYAGISQNRTDLFQTTPDQKYLVAATHNLEPNIIVYDTSTMKNISKVSVQAISSLSIFDRGRLAAVGSALGRVTIIDLPTGLIEKELNLYPSFGFGIAPVGAIAGSPDGDFLFTGVGLIMENGNYARNRTSAPAVDWLRSTYFTKIISLFGNKLIATFFDKNEPIRQAAWDPKGRYVAFIDNDNSLIIWNPHNPQVPTVIANLGSDVISLSISPSGNSIAVASALGISILTIN